MSVRRRRRRRRALRHEGGGLLRRVRVSRLRKGLCVIRRIDQLQGNGGRLAFPRVVCPLWLTAHVCTLILRFLGGAGVAVEKLGPRAGLRL